MPSLALYHAHVYFDEATGMQAKHLCEELSAQFEVTVGKMHQEPVGPHPRGNCQIIFKAGIFGEIVPWISRHRKGLTILVHPNTGNDLADHTEFTLWMGGIESLDLSVFTK